MKYPEYLIVSYTCSVEDIAFSIRFKNEGTNKNPDYKIYSYLIPKNRTFSEAIGGVINDSSSYDIHFFDFDDFQCPICHTGGTDVENHGINHLAGCSVCRRTVCMGASTFTEFHCTNDCGSVDPWKNAIDMKDQEGSQSNPDRARLKGGKQLLLPKNLNVDE